MNLLRAIFASSLLITPAFAEPASTLVMDVATGQILQQDNAGQSWYPASLTKMMTAYVTLYAVKEGRVHFDQAMRVSQKAARQAPSKMGFKPGSLLTIENALKIIMVKSANDVSQTLAEGISGSLEGFVREMNSHAQNLGMSGTRFINANGLPGAGQTTTARDMAILGRALLLQFPEHRDLWDIPSLSYNGKNIRNTNHLIGRFPNAIGIKTGFICASGFNVVAAAQMNGRTLISVVFGAETARERAETAAKLMLTHASKRGGEPVTAIQNMGGAAPDIRGRICKRRAKGQPPAAENADYYDQEPVNQNGDTQSPLAFFLAQSQQPQVPVNRSALTTYNPSRDAEPIFLGAKQGVNMPVLGVAALVKPTKEKPAKETKEAKVEKDKKPQAKKEAKKDVKLKAKADVITPAKTKEKPKPKAKDKA